jgi:hypothetical protein
MKTLALLEKQASVAAGTAQQTLTTPFLQGMQVVGLISVSSDFNGQAKIQVSDDNASWTDALVYPAAAGAENQSKMANVSLAGRYVRGNLTTRTAGNCSIYLLSDK